MVSLSSEGGGHAGASTFTSQSSSKSRDVCTQEELQRAERLGSAWLQRYRHIEGSSLLPSVDPLNELLLGLDFFADLREEVHTPTGKSSPASVASEDLNEGSETSENENEDEASEEEREEAKGTSQDAQFSEKNSQGHQQREYLRPIPTVIPNENVYIGFFLPLFLQEAKQALARAIKLDLGAPEEFVQVSLSAALPCSPFGASKGRRVRYFVPLQHFQQLQGRDTSLGKQPFMCGRVAAKR